MLAYQIRLALRSLRRNPVLTLLMIGGIALGIAVAMIFVTLHYVLGGNPIPSKSDRLHYVQLDSWDPERPWDPDEPDEPPVQLTHIDMVGLMESDIPTMQTGMFKGHLTVHPPDDGRPFRKDVRFCFADLFPMFEVPFRYGSGWNDEADRGPEPVVVLGHALNQRLFGGEDSVGRTLRIEDRDLRVVGVLEPWRPMPKFYDVLNGAFDGIEEIFMPFRLGTDMEAGSAGNNSSWQPWPEGGYEGLLQSEVVWTQMWVQLDTDEQRQRYRAFLDAYVTEQQKLGRLERPLNNRLRDVMGWLHFREVVPDPIRALRILALLFLVACSVNLIGILLGKFLARAPETGVRRALGASRRWVFVQHLIECEIIGVIGGLFGLALSAGGLELVARQFDSQFNFPLDLNLFLVALTLALASAMVAGVYPAWRICRIQPSAYLKAQ
jgi:putative ABC transport system permease protein